MWVKCVGYNKWKFYVGRHPIDGFIYGDKSIALENLKFAEGLVYD